MKRKRKYKRERDTRTEAVTEEERNANKGLPSSTMGDMREYRIEAIPERSDFWYDHIA